MIGFLAALFGFIWGTICAFFTGLLWLALGALGLCALVILAAIVRPQLFEVAYRGPSPSDLDAFRKLLRRGDLDAEIERVNMRNAQRRSP